jgi:beta-1,4-mannosyltransferase
MDSMRVTVAVLGDLGRSRRMLYHALALADSGADVDLVGYVEHALPSAVRTHPRIRLHRLAAPVGRARHRLPRAAFLAVALWNVLRQIVGLATALLLRVERPVAILVQTPPAIPTLAIARAAARLRGARLVVDWHNLGWTMLGLRFGRDHVLVRIARAYEQRAGRGASAHLCVSRALASTVATWGVGPTAVLHDRPVAAPARRPDPPGERDASVALVVSPTSWTADEDFELLLDAARTYDGAADAHRLPRLRIVVTGDGPLRATYDHRFGALDLRHVEVRTAWIAADEYPTFLGQADVGLCLHRSSSGLDLPMKVVDLFAAGVPVVAFDYGPTLAELVRPDENGILFGTADELAGALARLLTGFPYEATLLARLREGARDERHRTWGQAWTAVARPILLGSVATIECATS